ncbi:hypothetical protein QYF36_026532 [Acer negundo]|nr:hypothetical protein QYF36_026532 [Acer negundo]
MSSLKTQVKYVANFRIFQFEIPRYIYVWHALMGYWGGLVPDAAGTEKYNPTFRYPVQSPGNLSNMRDISMDCMDKYGVGTIDPSKASQFYDDLHKYLASQDMDGVKVDVQNILETISTGLGGRLKKKCYYRASDDYYPKNPTTQTLHIAAVAFNSVFLGEVVVPDWDMFYSLHCAAEYHAVARAVGGCGVYVSDKPGKHDFKILKRLVLAHGSVLRAKYPGRPTRDCLFSDPVMDGKRLLQKDVSGKISGKVFPADIEYFEEVSRKQWTGDCAVFSFNSGSLFRLSKEESFGVALTAMQCDVFAVSPIKVYNKKIEFAAMGLMNMYNSGGAVESVECISDSFSNCRILNKGRGGGSLEHTPVQSQSLALLTPTMKTPNSVLKTNF